MDEKWPEFVREGEGAERRGVAAAAQLTGWESVVFELSDDQDDVSDSSTAAIAP